jgi:hypothetical protein
VEIVMPRARSSGAAGLCQHFRDGGCQRGLAMIDVADRANIHVRLVPLKFRFGHLSAPAPCGLKNLSLVRHTTSGNG